MNTKQNQQKQRRDSPAPNKLGKLSQRRARMSVALSFFGGAILFTAWASQNYFENRSKAERDYLEKTQMIISVGQIEAQVWQIEYNAQNRRTPRDNDLTLVAMLNFLRSYSTVMAWEKARVLDIDLKGQPIEAKNEALAKGRAYFERRDVAGLGGLIDEVVKEKARLQAQLDGQYFTQIANWGTSAKLWNTIFLACYVAGAFCIGLGWILVHVFGWPAKLKED